MKNPAREKFLPMLSPYVDGELSPEERQQVEQHLAHSKESAMQVADFRAGDALIRHSLDLAADEVDWKDFTNQVMAGLTPEKLGLWERLRLSLSERFTYQRGTMVAAFAGAAAAALVAVPVAMRLAAAAPEGYANARVEVKSVSVDTDARVRPVVMETDSGDAVIWLVPDKKDHKKQDAGAGAPDQQGDL